MPSERLKVLWVNHRDPRSPRAGGAERTLWEVSRRLVRRGHRVVVVSGGWKGCLREEEMEGVTVMRYGSRILPHVVLPLIESCHDVSVVVDDLAHAVPWFSPWMTHKPGTAFFRHLHARTLPGQVPTVAARTLTWLERRYRAIYRNWPFVTESPSSAKDLQTLGIDSSQVTLIPPGVDTDLFRPGGQPAEPVLVYFSGMRRYKRPEHAILLLRRLLDVGVHARLLMVGTGPTMQELRQSSLDLGDRIQFCGRVSDEVLADLLRGATVHVQCSVAEGWGLTAIEAAASGIPTVGYRVPGLVDTVEGSGCGILVPDGNVEALSEATRIVLEAPERWRTVCRSVANGFSWEKTTSDWESHLVKLSDRAHLR